MDAKYNPFTAWRGGFNITAPSAQKINPGDNQKPLKQVVVSAPKTEKEMIGVAEGEAPLPTHVSLPPHLYVPESAQTIDISRSCIVLPGTIREVLMSFTAPDGVITNFLQYGIFNEGEEADLFEFIPEVNGNRVFPYHGDPNSNYRISLGTGFDLSSISLKTAYLPMQPLSEIAWRVTNISTTSVVMGVRMTGYYMSQEIRGSTRFGG